MLRNSLMTLLGEKGENNAVVVKMGEHLIDVEAITAGDQCIVLILDPEIMQDAINEIVTEELRKTSGLVEDLGSSMRE